MIKAAARLALIALHGCRRGGRGRRGRRAAGLSPRELSLADAGDFAWRQGHRHRRGGKDLAQPFGCLCRCAAKAAATAEPARGNAVARPAAAQYSRQHLAARHRLRRTRAQHGRLFPKGLEKATNGDHARRWSSIVSPIAGCRGTQPGARCCSAIPTWCGIPRAPTGGAPPTFRCRIPRQNRVRANKDRCPSP